MNSPVTWLDPSGLAPKGSPQYCAEQLAKMERCRKLFQNEMRKYDPFEDSIGGCPKKGGVTKPYGHYIEMISYQTCIRNAWANLWLYCRPWISARRLPSEATEPIPIRIRFPAHDPSQYISRESQRVWQIYPDYRPSLEQCLTAGGEVIIGIIFIIIFKGRCRSMGAPITVGAGA